MSGPPYHVLVFPGGTEIGLEVQRSLAHLKEIELSGAGSAADAHGPFAYRRWATVPDVSEPGWLEALAAVTDQLGADFVYPAHDEVLTALAERREELDARVVAPSVETCRITRSKRATYAALAGAVPVPRVYDDLPAPDEYPVFVKPDRGQGSQGARLAHDADDIRRAARDGADLVMSYLPGQEYTVDCFADREQGLLFARGRRRIRTRAGISMASRSEGDQAAFGRMAEEIRRRLGMHGAWFFQVREAADGTPTLLEVAPRVAGTMAVHRVLGVNFPLLSLYEHARVPVQIAPLEADVLLDRALTNRYRHDLSYSAVYVDLDDTLVVRGEVNTRLAPFLFQCLNERRRLVLITRHASDLQATLGRHRLGGLWDEVVHITDGREKADHIREPDAILVDDSFRERRVARERLGIATFDSSMVELLIDDRA
jgi:carbamoyl-phosphate synthase large subunit